MDLGAGEFAMERMDLGVRDPMMDLGATRKRIGYFMMPDFSHKT